MCKQCHLAIIIDNKIPKVLKMVVADNIEWWFLLYLALYVHVGTYYTNSHSILSANSNFNTFGSLSIINARWHCCARSLYFTRKVYIFHKIFISIIINDILNSNNIFNIHNEATIHSRNFIKLTSNFLWKTEKYILNWCKSAKGCILA